VDDDGYWVVRGRLTAEQGALVQKVLEQAMEEDFQEQHSESGIHVTPKTAQSQWLGEKMDDDLAVLGMLQLE
jgi:predicted metalloprotease with PDZ domain